jgi:hypothetical protein
MRIVVPALLLTSCMPFATSDPSEVAITCQLVTPDPTPENPTPSDPCLRWAPEHVRTFLLKHVYLWRETFPDTDEWAPEAPLLPHEIVILNGAETVEGDPVPPGLEGYTSVSGVVAIEGLNLRNLEPECSVLGHELVHVALVGAYRDGDRNHAAAPGPWNRQHDEHVQELLQCENVNLAQYQ